MADTGSVSYFMDCYYSSLTMRKDGTFQFPITMYLYVSGTTDITQVTGTFLFSVDLDGETEPMSLVLEESDSY
jgi:hypothetical protein